MAKTNFFEILSFFIFPFVVLIIHLIFSFYEIYNTFSWIDIPMHFLGGLSIAFTSILFLRFFRRKGMLEIKRWFIFFFIVISLVALVAVLWEFYEFLLKYFFNLNTQPSLEDTLLDLFMGLVGGIAGVIIFREGLK